MNENTINADVTMGDATDALLAGRYRVVKQLGQGGMGSVWLAEDTQLDNRQVAIKMLPSVLVSNKRAYQQLKSEALVSLKLTHPNIATVRAFEENNGNPFLVVDYIDGVTLDDYLADHDSGAVGAERRPYQDEDGRAVAPRIAPASQLASLGGYPRPPHPGGLPEAEVIRLLTPIAAALDYAHSKGVIHRDVKPGNVMIAKDGTPYILDFGIAREVQETMTRVTGKLSSGTLLYMSPEQLHGAAPTPAQDVYSFAAMAYECLTGHPPFSRGQIEYQIEHDDPAPLDPLFIKTGLGVMSGLSKRPENRPTSCAAVLADNGCRSEAVLSHSSCQEYSKLWSRMRRHVGEKIARVLLITLGVFFVGVCVLVAVGIFCERNKMMQQGSHVRKPQVYVTASIEGVPVKASIVVGLNSATYMTPILIDGCGDVGEDCYVTAECDRDGVMYWGWERFKIREGRQCVDVKLSVENDADRKRAVKTGRRGPRDSLDELLMFGR